MASTNPRYLPPKSLLRSDHHFSPDKKLILSMLEDPTVKTYLSMYYQTALKPKHAALSSSQNPVESSAAPSSSKSSSDAASNNAQSSTPTTADDLEKRRIAMHSRVHRALVNVVHSKQPDEHDRDRHMYWVHGVPVGSLGPHRKAEKEDIERGIEEFLDYFENEMSPKHFGYSFLPVLLGLRKDERKGWKRDRDRGVGGNKNE